MDKTFDATEAEARIYRRMGSGGGRSVQARTRGPGPRAFSIMIPPPNVTGVLHVGHAFNNTLQDVLTRLAPDAGFRHALAAGHGPLRASPRRWSSSANWPGRASPAAT